ncbi:hypothetical protein [Citromicrobium bathyomarinum]|uniref:hypothetical protein n=1 Tax=Citromicrobium bathyomarinum TaxID=72174 RepID=UPI00315B0FB1
MKFLLAVASLSLLVSPAAAQTAGQVHDARCAYVKSVILGRLMEDEGANQEVIQGVTTHVMYYFGRLEAVMERQAISDLIISEALKFENFDQIVDSESACDAGMEKTIDFMLSVGARLKENAR